MPEEHAVTVKLATALSRHTDNRKVIGCRLPGGGTLDRLLDDLDRQFPGIKGMICDDGGHILDGINVYVNGDNVRYLQGIETALKPGDMVNVIPAAAAG